MQYLIFGANKSKILIHSYFIIKEERNSTYHKKDSILCNILAVCYLIFLCQV